MARKSNALKEAVATPVDSAKEVKGEVVSRQPAKAAKVAPKVNLKDIKKALTEKQKEANVSEKVFLAALAAIDKRTKADMKMAEKPAMDILIAIGAMEKQIAKLRANHAAALTKVNKENAKIQLAGEKESGRLRKDKEKADIALAKEIAALQKVLDSATE